MAIIQSKIVPTEYDVYHENGRYVLTDDRGRKFKGIILAWALRRAEAAQDPSDPIHHPPYPSPHDPKEDEHGRS